MIDTANVALFDSERSHIYPTSIIVHCNNCTYFWHFSVMIQIRDKEASFKLTAMYVMNRILRISHSVLTVVLIHDFEMNRFVVRIV